MANEIRKKREALGLSQTKLASRTGLTNSAVSDFELNKRWPWPKARRALALALGCTEVELFPDRQEKEGERHES